MNNINLVGRLTGDPIIRVANGEKAVKIANFTVACDRRFKKEGQPEADFIPCTCFGPTAEFVEKYFKKGQRIGVTGSIQTGSYEKDGQKHYTWTVAVNGVEFVESKKTGTDDSVDSEDSSDSGFYYPENEDGLPFN